MKLEDLKIGHCKIDGLEGFIRKINDYNPNRVIICFHMGTYRRGLNCEKFEDFSKRKVEFVEPHKI